MQIDRKGKWRLYWGNGPLPIGAEAVGTVTRPPFCDKGALILMPLGMYVQGNAGAIRSLPQDRIVRLLEETKPVEPCAGKPKYYIVEAAFLTRPPGRAKPNCYGLNPLQGYSSDNWKRVDLITPDRDKALERFRALVQDDSCTVMVMVSEWRGDREGDIPDTPGSRNVSPGARERVIMFADRSFVMYSAYLDDVIECGPWTTDDTVQDWGKTKWVPRKKAIEHMYPIDPSWHPAGKMESAND